MCGVRLNCQQNTTELFSLTPEEVGHCMLPYIEDQILELVRKLAGSCYDLKKQLSA